MADRRGVLVPLIIVAFILFSPDPAQSPAARFERLRTLHEVVEVERYFFNVQQNSSFGDLDAQRKQYLNITGFRSENDFAWDGLPFVKERAREQLHYSLGTWGSDALENSQVYGSRPSLYENVTGHVSGRWVRSKAQEHVAIPLLNLTQYAPEGPFGRLPLAGFQRNITGKTGDVHVRFHERSPLSPKDFGIHNVTGMRAEISIRDDQSSTEFELNAYGVYFASMGQAILTTTSGKFGGIFGLPHLVLSRETFGPTKSFLNQSISRAIELQADGQLDAINPWSANPDKSFDPFSGPECELIVYLQQQPPESVPSGTASAQLSFLERELHYPTGAFLPSAPDLRFSMVAFSPDCGYALESQGPPDYAPQRGNHLSGPKIDVLYRRSRRHLLFFTAAIASQMVLLVRQMREANTPSTRSRISFYTIAMLSLGDGFTTMTLLMVSLFIAGLWINLISTAFLSFISVSFFGMRFLMDIWLVQAPERERRAREQAEEERQRQQRLTEALAQIRAEQRARREQLNPAENNEAPPDQPAPQPLAVDSLPLPVTAQRPTDTGAVPVFMPSDQEGLQPIMEAPGAAPTRPGQAAGSSFGALYTRFYLLLLVSLFISLNATSWPMEVRRIYFALLGLAYLSFWVPQIMRNIYRNCRHALNWEYVVGQSLLRLGPFVYIYGYEKNVLFAKADYYSLGLLVIWVWIQVVVLVSQELIGPRWFVRQHWVPPAYDYHPILRDDEEGANMPMGLSEAQVGAAGSMPESPTAERRGSVAKETRDRGKRVYDCAICMQELEVPVVEAGSPGDNTLAGSLLARRSYMVTPCRHIFHSTCLEGWMKYRLQCPICRETLPPL